MACYHIAMGKTLTVVQRKARALQVSLATSNRFRIAIKMVGGTVENKTSATLSGVETILYQYQRQATYALVSEFVGGKAVRASKVTLKGGQR